eukprot:2990557-Rhodomonas_salina.1
MRPLKGLTKPGIIWELRKSVYCLRQSNANWAKLLAGTLKDFKLQSLFGEDVVFYHREPGKDLVIVICYVDDVIILSRDTQALSDLRNMLRK